jgi:hypothetical protein
MTRIQRGARDFGYLVEQQTFLSLEDSRDVSDPQ